MNYILKGNKYVKLKASKSQTLTTIKTNKKVFVCVDMSVQLNRFTQFYLTQIYHPGPIYSLRIRQPGKSYRSGDWKHQPQPSVKSRSIISPEQKSVSSKSELKWIQDHCISQTKIIEKK